MGETASTGSTSAAGQGPLPLSDIILGGGVFVRSAASPPLPAQMTEALTREETRTWIALERTHRALPTTMLRTSSLITLPK